MDYNPETAKVIAQTIIELNQVLQRETKTSGIISLAQMYLLQKRLKKFRQCGKDSAISEMRQLNNCTCFQPMKIEDMSLEEKKRAVESLIF